jgi:F-type H+-transporting ATPase subunit delta
MSLAVASRYANALADLVLGPQSALSSDQAVGQIQAFESVLAASADLRAVLLSPAVPLKQKNNVVAKLAARLGLHAYVRNFIHILVRNRRIGLFDQIRASLERTLDERTGVIQTELASATELTAESRNSIEAQLGRLTGRRVRCRYCVDANLLGGVVARIGAVVYDGSVRGQLDALRRKMAG